MCADLVREEDPRKYTPDQVSIAQVKNRQFSVTVSSLGQYHKDVSCGRGAKNQGLVSQVLAPIKGFVLCVLTVDWVSSSAAGGSRVTIEEFTVLTLLSLTLNLDTPTPATGDTLAKSFQSLNLVRNHSTQYSIQICVVKHLKFKISLVHLVFVYVFELEVGPQITAFGPMGPLITGQFDVWMSAEGYCINLWIIFLHLTFR